MLSLCVGGGLIGRKKEKNIYGHGYDLGGQVSDPGRGKTFLVSKMFRPALGTTQPPVQWLPGVISPGLNAPKGEADHSPPHSVQVKKGGAMPSWSST
jgi:hypothetical protein